MIAIYALATTRMPMMDDKQFRAETAYQASLILTENLLHAGLLTEKEFCKAKELLLARYKPSLGRLFSEFG
jgi:hypothetical protein